jgi:hypothetical protein
VVGGFGDRPPGLDALAAIGDIRIGNSRMVAIIDAVGSPHHLGPSGGTLIDLAPRDAAGTGDDGLNQIFQAVGILPDDAAHYHTFESIDGSPEFVALIARGRLDGRPDVTVVTRYEVRPCEPGIRIRTDLYHGGRDPETFYLSDAYYWGGREMTPFVPLVGQGFAHPELDLAELGDAYRDIPLMAARPHNVGVAAYSVVACDHPTLEAFQSTSISAAGKSRAIVLAGDSLSFERFVAVAAGHGLGGAAGVALEARGMLFDEASVLVSGRVVSDAGDPLGGDERAVSLLFYEPAPGSDPDAAGERTPWSEVVPGADGSFQVRLPVDRGYRIESHVLGRPLPARTGFVLGRADQSLPDLVLPVAGVIDARVTDANGAPVHAELILTPAPSTARDQVTGSVYGEFVEDSCVPYLGPPHGGSPACNRVLLEADGTASFAAPEGTYDVYASRGPFATLDVERVVVAPGEHVSVELTVDLLPGLVPDGVLSADFHVHAGASFDSSLPERDRARTFVATGVDVLAATDHDVVTTYEAAIADLGIGDRVHVIPGVETTGQVLFHRPPGSEIPQVIGHYNFWPIRVDRDRPRNGGPWDELLEPGALFDRVAPLYEGTGVAQLNHPFADSTFGRDEGYFSAIDYDPRVAVPAEPADTPEGQLPRRPAGGRSNLDHDVQEVMNGSATESFLKYRVLWHSFLDQGILKGGTANSDSHTLAGDVLGYPRNLVFGDHSLAAFDRERFQADVRAGRMIGTNGPVLLVCLSGEGADCRGPSLEPFRPADSAELRVEVRAAPWIPVEQIRVLVNGDVVKVFEGDDLDHPTDPFGEDGLLRFQGAIPLTEILAALPPERDAWIVVEAGMPLWPAADLDGHGIPDTTDNDGDGLVDLRDRDGLEEDDYFREPPAPAATDPRFHLHVVSPGTYPTSFTNPLLIDRRGDGWTPPGLP